MREPHASTKETKPEEKNQTNDSSTVVNFVLDEPRITVGFKCNKRLWDAFVSHSKREYGSVCYILEPIMTAILTAQVNLSRTMKAEQQPIVIENLNVQRVVQRHRRVYHESSYTDVVQDVVQIGHPGVCFDCKTRHHVDPYITVSNERVFLCGSCAKRWVTNRRIEVVG